MTYHLIKQIHLLIQSQCYSVFPLIPQIWVEMESWIQNWGGMSISPLNLGWNFQFQPFFDGLYSLRFRSVSFDICTKGKGLRSVSDLVVERNHVLIFEVCILLQLQLSILNNSISFQLFLGNFIFLSHQLIYISLEFILFICQDFG